MSHLTVAELHSIEEGSASPELLDRTGAHARECETCSRAIDRIFREAATTLAAAFPASGATDLCPVDEIDAYVDGRLAEERREAVALHAAECATCAAEIDDLQLFSRKISVRDGRSWWGVAAAAAVVAVIGGVATFREAPRPAEPRPAAVQVPAPRVVRPVVAQPAAVAASPETSPRTDAWQKLVDDATRTGILPVHAELAAWSGTETYRGSAGDAAVPRLEPSGEAVPGTRPVLSWPAAEGARYRVIVNTLDGEEIAASGELAATRWQVPRELRRGAMYRWQVEVTSPPGVSIMPIPPAPPAIFRVATSAEIAEIEEVKRTRGRDDLLLGLLYARTGLFEDAERHLKRYYAAEPSPDVERLLTQIP